ncbi:MAG: putative TNF receptor-associated factor 5 [Edafosvirus sp.]|uniref:Putative TNF receptor-associated factor 5 n=1 Tax=Edafosvirus sp. TaxID=2487765 RepID=A0A3G4ZWF5_9VIRU|nr:MAG: putative TNF receptor-associated factor 5 [Edafosvirus sp.]
MDLINENDLILLFSDIKDKPQNNDFILTKDNCTKDKIIDEDFIFCTICTMFCKKPTCLDGCRHIFCHECLIEWIKICEKSDEDVQKCPVCKIQFNEYFYSHTHDIILADLKFKCCNKNCNFIGTNELLTKHSIDCKFQMKECNICKKDYIFEEIKNHYLDCNLCNEKQCYESIDDHQEEDCLNALVKCKNELCSYYVIRSDMEKHIKKCEFSIKNKEQEKKFNCKYYNILGCSTKLPKLEIIEHEKNILYHFKLSLKNHTKFKKMIKSIDNDNEHVKIYNSLTINDLYVGLNVDLMCDRADYIHQLISPCWEPACIVDINYGSKKVHVSYLRWDVEYDELIPFRIIPFKLAIFGSHGDMYSSDQEGMLPEYRENAIIDFKKDRMLATN